MPAGRASSETPTRTWVRTRPTRKMRCWGLTRSTHAVSPPLAPSPGRPGIPELTSSSEPPFPALGTNSKPPARPRQGRDPHAPRVITRRSRESLALLGAATGGELRLPAHRPSTNAPPTRAQAPPICPPTSELWPRLFHELGARRFQS